MPRWSLHRWPAMGLMIVPMVWGCSPGEQNQGRGVNPPQRPPSGLQAEAVSDLPPSAAPAAAPARLGLGAPADPALIAAWDIDVGPDGVGLPVGRGTPAEGAGIYAQCVACHGANGEGGVGPQLVGPTPKTGFGDDFKDHPRTIGNWWTHATTLFDYIRRAMPQHAPGSLTADQTYALTAYLLHRNELVPADFVADARSLPAVKMGNQVVMVPDDRESANRVR